MQEFLYKRRQLVQPDRINGRNPDRAADHLLHFLQLALQLLVGVQHLLRRLVDAVSFPRELKLFLAAVDEERLEMPLHRPSLLAHRRLRDAIQLGRFGETFGFDQIGEDFEVFNLHKLRGCQPKGATA